MFATGMATASSSSDRRSSCQSIRRLRSSVAASSITCSSCARPIHVLQTLVVWLGYPQVFAFPTSVKRVTPDERIFPSSSRNPWKTFARGSTTFSFMPIYACLALAAAGLVLAAVLAIDVGTDGRPARLPLGAADGAVAVVGVYVIRIYKDVRGRPAFIVASRVGLSDGR